jgi:hypothetical protein
VIIFYMFYNDSITLPHNLLHFTISICFKLVVSFKMHDGCYYVVIKMINNCVAIQNIIYNYCDIFNRFASNLHDIAFCCKLSDFYRVHGTDHINSGLSCQL